MEIPEGPERHLATMFPDLQMNQRVLVVADNPAIAAHARRWAEAFAASATVHRVRLVTTGLPREIEAVAAEARSLGATAIITAAAATPRAVAAAVAERLGLPVAVDEAPAADHG
jgi:CheY-like chemotaxis protein